ncbi:hypothetical protein ACOSQ3_021539 [Xanthoceras sorbifolium]
MGNPFAESRSEEQQYENYLYFQYNNRYPTIDFGAPLRCFLCRGLHVSTDCQVGNLFAGSHARIAQHRDQGAQQTQADAQNLAIQGNQLATEIQWQEHEPYPMEQCNETTMEIKEQIEQQIWVEQVEMEVSKSLLHKDDTSTFPEPLEICLVLSTTAKEESYKDTYVFVDLREGKPKPPPPFEQNPYLGRKEIPSYSRYAVLGELSSLPVIWLGWCGKLIRRYQL